MSEFSDLLSLLIKAKDINIGSLTSYCDLDRSTMYKLINGRRNPASKEQVRRMAEFMNLSPMEHQTLMDAYQITRIGWDVFYRRRSIVEFILNFQNIHAKSSFYFSAAAPEESAPAPQGEGTVPLSGRVQVSSAIHSLCLRALQEGEGSLSILAQPEHLEALDVAASLLSSPAELAVHHIICINNSRSLLRSRQDYNLQCLTRIIPFFGIGCQYHPYYYYDDVNSHFHNLNFMPCLFLSRSLAVICSSDLKEGILFRTAPLTELLQSRFDSILKSSQPLILSFHSSLGFHLKEFPAVMGSSGDGCSLSAEPCLVPYFSEEFLKKYLRGSLPGSTELLEPVRNYVETISKTLLRNYFTQDGARKFLETGRMHEIPEEYYTPLEYADRVLLLRRLQSQLAAGRQIRLMNTPLDRFPMNLHIFSSPDLGYILFSGGGKPLNYLLLKEQNLLGAFYDFASTMEECGLLCTAEETDAFLRDLIG